MSSATVTSMGKAIAFAAVAAASGLALAQVAPRPATPGEPLTTIPEKMLPPSEGIPSPKAQAPPQAPTVNAPTSGSKETLSEKLDRTDGVLTPPANVAPPMTVPAPAPNIDRDMVVPPPAPQQAPPKAK